MFASSQQYQHGDSQPSIKSFIHEMGFKENSSDFIACNKFPVAIKRTNQCQNLNKVDLVSPRESRLKPEKEQAQCITDKSERQIKSQETKIQDHINTIVEYEKHQEEENDSSQAKQIIRETEKTACVEIPFENRSIYERFERFFSKI